MSDEPEEWMLIGRVVGAHGVQGELKVEALTDFPDRFSLLDSVFLGERKRKYDLESTRQHKHVLITLKKVDDRTAAQALRGTEIWIPRAEAIPLAQDEYYADDIIGLTVETVAGLPLGQIQDILATGANDVYVVQGAKGEILVPAIRDVVREIDIPGKRIVIEMVEGLAS